MKCKLIKMFIFGILIFLLSSRISHSQGCCTVGSVFLGGLERAGVNYGALNISLGYEFTNVKDAFNQNTKISDPILKGADAQNMTFGLEYGLTENISVVAITTIMVVKNKEVKLKDSANTEIIRKFSGSGFGDITLFGKYKLPVKIFRNTLEIDIGLGAKLPTGSFTNEENGSRLPIDVQPGNGSIELIGSLFFIKTFPAVKSDISGNFSYRYIGANFNGYKTGDEIYTNLFFRYNLLRFISPLIGVRARFAKMDLSNGRILPGTGSRSVYLIPGIVYHEGPFALNLYYQFPIYRNVNRIQLTANEIIGAEVKYTFSF